MKSILTVAETYFKMATGKLQEGQDNKEIDLTPDKDNLAAQDAQDAQKKQEPKPEIPSWVPGNLPEDEKHEFAEACKAAYESDNNTFDFKGRTYKITEKELVGNQDKLDVNGNGKIDSEDLAALRAGKKPVGEHHLENEVETPGQTQYPGSNIKDVNGNGIIDGEDKAEMPKEDEDEVSESTIKEGEEERYNRSTGTFRTGRTQYKAPLTVSHAEKARQASDEAHRASQHAEKTKSPEHFHAAAKAHEHAIEMHKAADKAAYTPGLSGGKQQMHAGYAAHARERAAYHSKNPVKESAENPTDTLTIDVPAMIRALEKAREDFKTDEDIHNFVQDLLKKKDSTIDTNALPTNEALDPKADAGVWIKDFQDSDDPKFAGKSKDERKQQALAAWYAARRDAGIKESTQISENVAGDPHASHLSTKANQASALAHSAPAEAGAGKHHHAAMHAHQNAAEHYRVYANHAADPILKHVAGIHQQFHSDMAQHHLLRHLEQDPMLKKEAVNEGAPADAKAGPEVMDPLTQATKDDHDDETKVEEAPYTNKADGSENIVPATKNAPNPTPTPKLTQKESTTMSDPIKSIRNVADAYRSMNFSEAYSDGSHLSEAEKNHPATKAAMKASSDAETASKGLNMKKVSQPNYDDHLKHHAALGHHQWAADRHSDAAEAHPAGSRARQYHVSQMKHHDSRAQQHVKATAGSRAGYRDLVARNQ